MQIKPGDKLISTTYEGKFYFLVTSIEQEPRRFEKVIIDVYCEDDLLKENDSILMPELLNLIDNGILIKD